MSSITREILKIRETFPKLQAEKIKNIYKIINGDGKFKPKLNIMMKDLSRKQVIVSMMNNKNKLKFIKVSSAYITNLHRALKNIKSEIIADFVCINQTGIIIVINKVASPLNLQTIKKYVKNTNLINSDEVHISHFFQSKSYLKITSIPYLLENTNTSISSNVVKSIIKSNHIFNNITVASKPYIIKVSSKLDIAIIWLDIWDIQSSSKAKGLINKCFNIGSIITTIQGINMNLSVS